MRLKVSLFAVVLALAGAGAVPAGAAEGVPAGVVAAEPGVPELSYEAWKHLPLGARGAGDAFFAMAPYAFGPAGLYGLWDHDGPEAAVPDDVAAWWAGLPAGYVNDGHPRYYAFLWPGEQADPLRPRFSSTYAGYQQRFLDEARAGGDTVLTFGARVRDATREPVYAVFAAGTPPERMAETLAWHLLQRQMFGLDRAEAEAIVAEAAAAAGLAVTPEALRSWFSASPRDPPPPTYEEWVHGVPGTALRPRGSALWWHDEPLAERIGRSLALWGPPSAYADVSLHTWFPGTFIVLGDGDAHDAFEGRWLVEAIAAGDIAVPFPLPPPAPAGDAPARPLAFAVFRIASPADSVEAVLRTYLAGLYDLPPAAIEAVVVRYRAMDGG